MIVRRNDHFLSHPSGNQPEHLPGLIDRLRQQVSAKVGVELKIGTASLPIDGFTFDGLVEKATTEMEGDHGAFRAIEIERLRVHTDVPWFLSGR